MFAGGKISLLVIPGTDLLALAGSVARLATVRPDALLPGHGPFPLRDAHTHIERAHNTFESMVLPAQILRKRQRGSTPSSAMCCSPRAGGGPGW